MQSFWNVVNEVIDKSDVLLEVVDARFIDDTRHAELENKIRKAGKKLIIVVNKADLVQKETLEEYKKKIRDIVFISAKEHLGTSYLREAIYKAATARPVFVGVVGYPNTGKSSVVNVLKGKQAAGTSRTSGFTKGKQKVRIAKDLYLLDTPGVIPYREEDELKHVLIAVKNVQQIKEPDIIAIKIIELFRKENPRGFEDKYDVLIQEDTEETIAAVAKKMNKLMSGGRPDIDSTSRKIIDDWQTGRLKL